MMAPFGPDDFRAATLVSRETLARLERYARLLEKWSGAINLVGRDSLPDLWHRHFLDSAQLCDLMPPQGARARRLLDLGSGAGFPGLVLAILGAGEVHLVEADAKKAVFLSEAARQTGTKITLHTCRIEDLAPMPVDVVTARALAPLPRLLELVEPFFRPRQFGPRTEQETEQNTEQANAPPGPPAAIPAGATPVALLLKGREVERELTDCAETWMMHAEVLPSRTDPDGRIIRLTGLEKKGRRL